MTDQKPPALAFHGSRLLTSWLKEAKVSLAMTTYQAGKVFLIGLQPDGRLSVFERTFERPMGLGVGQGRFWMSSVYQLWRFEDFLGQQETRDGYDALYVPVTGHTTGDLDIHDIHEDAEGKPIFVATRFNCLATLSERGSFREVWRPPFIDRLAAEDRCHLNGLAMRDGQPAYVTCLSRTNVFEGWREKRRDGGMVLEVPTGEVVAGGLSMPHSPRLHQGKLWMLQAGTGEFGRIDLATGKFEPVCFLPGFARGLAFVGDYAVIGISRPRENRTFEGLVLNERLQAEGVSAQCAICVVNLRTGDIEHRLEIGGIVEEIYDVNLLPGVIRPMALGFRTEEIRFAVKPEALPDPTGPMN
ncbi:MAG: TIGR03032 family protein [Rhodobacteraceae bacterium]|nr:TIGR03032 family protein [Paracoccaceae bacterium]